MAGSGSVPPFYLFCGAVAGAVHVLWGKAGMPAALGSAGAVAGVLGAYLVFFPDVPIEMYGMGRVATVPAYLFACAWAVSVFLWGWGPGPLSNLLNPAPYGLAGNLAGFGTGVACAVLWKTVKEEDDPHRIKSSLFSSQTFADSLLSMGKNPLDLPLSAQSPPGIQGNPDKHRNSLLLCAATGTEFRLAPKLRECQLQPLRRGI